MILGSYEVLSEVGSGTFGTVLKVRDMRYSKVMAMKCISKTKIQRNKMGIQVKKEINTMKILNHPNIVRIKDVLMDKSYLYITMEYVSGGELYSKMASTGKMQESMAKKYFRQIIEGVKYCHDLNICHRDIKPENILLDANDMVKIADFGFASIMEIDDYKRPSSYISEVPLSQNKHELDEFLAYTEDDPIAKDDGFERMESKIMMKLSTICGTSMYMAPEITKRTGYFGDKADIWSCGVVLFYLLVYSLPFKDGEVKGDDISTKLPPYLTDDAKDLLCNILRYEPEHRLSARRILDHSWFHEEDKNISPKPTESESIHYVPPPPQEETIKTGENKSNIRLENTGWDMMIPGKSLETCSLLVEKALEELSWMYKSTRNEKVVIKASKMTDMGISLIQLDLESRNDSVAVSLTNFGCLSAEIEALVKNIIHDS